MCCKFQYIIFAFRFGITEKVKNINKMKQDIHPEFRSVVFHDLTSNEKFLIGSTVATSETIEFEGETYPLFKVEISSASHPYYTGKKAAISAAGRVDRFNKKYGKK